MTTSKIDTVEAKGRRAAKVAAARLSGAVATVQESEAADRLGDLVERAKASDAADRLGDLVERAKASEAADRLGDLVERAKASDAAMRASVVAGDLAERARDSAERARDSEAYARAQVRGQQVAHDVAERLRELPVDEWAAQVGAWLREAAQTLQSHPATTRARRRSGAALSRLGDALTDGSPRRLPARRRVPALAVLLAGFAAGFAAAGIMARRRRKGETDAEAYVASAQRLVDDAAARADDRLQEGPVVDQVTPIRGSVADHVRAALAADPRTADLRGLDVNVAEGIVFVRGAVPAASDEAAVRDVLGTIDGVTDADVQVTVLA